jgi:hypothetical protein
MEKIPEAERICQRLNARVAASSFTAPADAFAEDGSLKDKAQQDLCKSVVEAFEVAARKFAKP